MDYFYHDVRAELPAPSVDVEVLADHIRKYLSERRASDDISPDELTWDKVRVID